MDKDIAKILITEEQLRARIAQLGQELTAEYEGKFPLIVGVLKGVVVFYADMVRQIKVPCQMDFMWISSYAGTDSTGRMVVKRDVSQDIEGRHVLILEDIYDTGSSLDFTYHHLLSKNPASLKICTLLGNERGKCGHAACGYSKIACKIRKLKQTGERQYVRQKKHFTHRNRRYNCIQKIRQWIKTTDFTGRTDAIYPTGGRYL